MKPDTKTEPLCLMEPMRIPLGSRHREPLSDLAVELAAESARFEGGLPAPLKKPLAGLVRSMNCYYSNLIEGHYTHPVEIERALEDHYDTDPEKRNLQLEAKAHIAVQQWIDDGGLAGRAATVGGIREIHRRFGERLPEALLWATPPDGGEPVRVVPGELRTTHVRVGRHLAVAPESVPRFLARFEAVYAKLGRMESILATPAAHHRILWIHPFADGNGRTARLMSHAMLLDSLDSGGIWSVARGLARKAQAYKSHLAACDQSRRNDLDGRGNLSEESLAEFTRFFLETCLDQIRFMEHLLQPSRLRHHILAWAEEEVRAGTLPARAGRVLEVLLYRGELPRREIPGIVDTGERQARRIVSALAKAGAVTADSSRAPLRLALSASLAPRWLPGLFPEPEQQPEYSEIPPVSPG